MCEYLRLGNVEKNVEGDAIGSTCDFRFYEDKEEAGKIFFTSLERGKKAPLSL